MAALRINIPACSSRAGRWKPARSSLQDGKLKALDLVDAMVAAADDRCPTRKCRPIEQAACPTCGSCSGMFTANSMNCLTEALGLSLPGNGSTLATHADRKGLFVEAGRLVVDLARRYYEGRTTRRVLPRNVASFARLRERDEPRHRDGRLDQHRAAPARGRARGRRRLHHARHRPAVAQGAVPVQGRPRQGRRPHGGRAPRRGDHGDPRRAGPRRAARHRAAAPCIPRTHGRGAGAVGRLAAPTIRAVQDFFRAAPGGVPTQTAFSQDRRWDELDIDRENGRDPQPGARLQQGWRPRGAVRQSRRGRLHREDRGRRRSDPELRRPGPGLRKPGRSGRAPS